MQTHSIHRSEVSPAVFSDASDLFLLCLGQTQGRISQPQSDTYLLWHESVLTHFCSGCNRTHSNIPFYSGGLVRE